MKKLIIIICAAIILGGSAYFLVVEGVLRLPNGMVRDVIGPRLESRYTEQASVLLSRMIKRLSIEGRKIDYLVQQVEGDLQDLAGEGRGGAAGVLQDFAGSHPSCSRVRLIDRELRIRYSTSENDVTGARVDEQVYTVMFESGPSSRSRVLVDTLIEKLVLYRRIGPHALLFYYEKNMLDPAFAAAGDLEYRGYVLTADHTLLINFPEIGAADEKNMARLVRAMRENRAGALRVKLDGQDKTVYFTTGEEQYADWTLGITLDTGSVRVSTVGAAVLVIQACVVAALVIFLISAFGRKQGEPAGAAVGESTEGRAEPVVAAGDAAGEVAGGLDGTGVEGAGELEPEVVTSGVVSLDEVEEMEELEEVGEAEVAADLETVDESVDDHEEERKQADEPVEEPGAGDDGAPRGSGPEERFEERIENDRIDLDRYAGNPSGELPGLDKLLDLSTDWKSEAPEAGETGEEGLEEEGLPPSIPEEAYAPAGLQRDDELARLIHRIEDSGLPEPSGVAGPAQASVAPPAGTPVMPVGTGEAKAPEEFRGFMRKLGLSKGALLVESGGVYRPAAILGLSEHTASRLRFGANENIVRNILMQDKILYIRDDAFMSRLMRAKFDLQDTSTVKRLFFAPILDPRRGVPLAAILMICLTTGEAVAEHSRSETVLKELKRIKNKLPSIL